MEYQNNQTQELLEKAFKQGYWDDAKQVVKRGEKLWEAPVKMRVEKLSPLLLDLTCNNMSKKPVSVLEYCKSHKANVVGIYFNAFGEKHVDSFFSRLNLPEGIGKLRINIIPNAFQAPVMWTLLPWLRYKTPKEWRDEQLVMFKDLREQAKSQGMENTAVGWINIVDQQGRVRWQAHGTPKDHEIDSIHKHVAQLSQ
ncbi:ATPase assembly factor ATP10 [Gorgonomyces haynaldii]|nr:ATPase assembly factor ATP10 [Gorgonomyces haynaldii]